MSANEMLIALRRVVSEASIALTEGQGGFGVDVRDTMRRVLDRVNKAKCVGEAAIAKAAREEVECANAEAE